MVVCYSIVLLQNILSDICIQMHTYIYTHDLFTWFYCFTLWYKFQKQEYWDKGNIHLKVKIIYSAKWLF